MSLFRIAAAAGLLYAVAPDATARAVQDVLAALGAIRQDVATDTQARALAVLNPTIGPLDRPETREIAGRLVALCRAEPARCETLARPLVEGRTLSP